MLFQLVQGGIGRPFANKKAELSIEAQLEALYTKHNPAKLPEIEALFIKYKCCFLWHIKIPAHNIWAFHAHLAITIWPKKFGCTV